METAAKGFKTQHHTWRGSGFAAEVNERNRAFCRILVERLRTARLAPSSHLKMSCFNAFARKKCVLWKRVGHRPKKVCGRIYRLQILFLGIIIRLLQFAARLLPLTRKECGPI